MPSPERATQTRTCHPESPRFFQRDAGSAFRLSRPRLRCLSRATIAFSSLLLYFIASSFSPLLAEHTRTWRQSTYDDFLKGTSNGVAVRSDGRLELSQIGRASCRERV